MEEQGSNEVEPASRTASWRVRQSISESSASNAALIDRDATPVAAKQEQKAKPALKKTTSSTRVLLAHGLQSSAKSVSDALSPTPEKRSRVKSLFKKRSKTKAKKSPDSSPSSPAGRVADAVGKQPTRAGATHARHARQKRLSMPFTHTCSLDRSAPATELTPRQEEAEQTQQNEEAAEEEKEKDATKVPLRSLAKKKKSKKPANVSVLMGSDLQNKCQLSFAVIDRDTFDQQVVEERHLSSTDSCDEGETTGRDVKTMLGLRKSVTLSGPDLRAAFASRYTVRNTSGRALTGSEPTLSDLACQRGAEEEEAMPESEEDRRHREEEARARKMRKTVVLELVETERAYIDGLSMTVDVFLRPVRQQKLLNPYEIVTIFGNIEAFLPLHVALMDDLESSLLIASNQDDVESTYSQWVGEIFADHAPRLQKAYISYCSNQPAISSRLREYRAANPAFDEFLEMCFKMEVCKKQDLASFLIRPLQRLCKYPLFFSQLDKYTRKGSAEYTRFKDGQSKVLMLVNSVNTTVNQITNLTTLVDVTLRLENSDEWKPKLVRDNHEFLFETIERLDNKECTIFVLTDMVLFCRLPDAGGDKQAEARVEAEVASRKLRVFLVLEKGSASLCPSEDETEINLMETNAKGLRTIRCATKNRKRLLVRKLSRCLGDSKGFSDTPELPLVFRKAPVMLAVGEAGSSGGGKPQKVSHRSFSKSSSTFSVHHVNTESANPPAAKSGSDGPGPSRARARSRPLSLPPGQGNKVSKSLSNMQTADRNKRMDLAKLPADDLVTLLLHANDQLQCETEARQALEEELESMRSVLEMVREDNKRFRKELESTELHRTIMQLRAQLGAAQERLIALEEG